MSDVKTEVSRVSDRTFEMCVPSERCMPLHSMQSSMPRLIEHQSTLISSVARGRVPVYGFRSLTSVRVRDLPVSREG